jgi:hypothetical protein
MDFKLNLDVSMTEGFFDKKTYEETKKDVLNAYKVLRDKSGA